MTDENVSPRTHPEHFCQRCGGPNLMCWHAPSPLWNTVMRDAEGLEKLSIVCPRCFGELAREAGVADFFCLTTHDAKVSLPTVFGDGRVWDATQCKWVEAEAAAPALDVARLTDVLLDEFPHLALSDTLQERLERIVARLAHPDSDGDAR